MQPTILAAARRASCALDAFPRPSKENLYMRNVMGRIWRVWGGIYGRSLRPPGEAKTKHSHSVSASRNWVNESQSGHSRNNSAWLGWDGAGIGEQSLLAPHSLLCSLHPPHPGASLLLVVTDSSSLRATSTCCCSNRSLLPCLFLVPRFVAPLRLPQSFFPSSSVLRLITRCCCAAAARNPLQAPLPSRLAQPRPYEKRHCFHPLADSFAQEPFRSVEYTNYPLC